MKRVKPEIRTARVNVEKTLKMIETDILDNQHEVIHRQDYYTTKYRGDILNDINVGIFLNDSLEVVIQIYVSNGFTSIRKRFIMNKDGRSIQKETIETKTITVHKEFDVYDGEKLDTKVREFKENFKRENPHFTIKEVIVNYPKNEKYLIELELQ